MLQALRTYLSYRLYCALLPLADPRLHLAGAYWRPQRRRRRSASPARSRSTSRARLRASPHVCRINLSKHTNNNDALARTDVHLARLRHANALHCSSACLCTEWGAADKGESMISLIKRTSMHCIRGATDMYTHGEQDGLVRRVPRVPCLL